MFGREKPTPSIALTLAINTSDFEYRAERTGSLTDVYPYRVEVFAVGDDGERTEIGATWAKFDEIESVAIRTAARFVENAAHPKVVEGSFTLERASAGA